MSVAHQRLAWDIAGLTTNQRIVLLAYALHACEVCGLCWPGPRRLMILTGLGDTTLAEVRRTLVQRELIKIHAYEKGGRGRSTEYVVMPNDMELSTAPCGKCVENQKTPRPAAGI